MKKNFLYIFLSAILLIPCTTFSGNLPFNPGDNVILFTDRALYITGEQVRFYATVWNGNNLDKPVQSQILYCEIITPDGNKISGNKFLIIQSSVGGCIEIPGNILTGNYYIRAYTKLMRNYGPVSYSYRQIRIVNPWRVEVLGKDNNQSIPDMQVIPATSDGLKDLLLVSVDKASYNQRDTILLTVQPKSTIVSGIKNISVSVVPEGTQSTSLLIQSVKKQAYYKSDYNTENRGLSISGKLTDLSSANPKVGKKVNLSIIGDGRDFMAIRTDSLGRFFFALPYYYGSRDLFICAEKTASLNDKIWVDNDFCNTPIHLPSLPFNLSETERNYIQNMAINEQINSSFYSDTILDTQNSKKDESAFYGIPSNILSFDKYIELPTLEEYFNELPSMVKVRKRKGESYFAVQGATDLSFSDPLILIDWVAVDEPSKILAISPQNIARIEVVNEFYVKGGQTYGGIISIISKKSDFAGIDLPSAGIFINYHFLDKIDCRENFDNSSVSHPDSRNTILWKPGATLQNSQPEKIIFTAPDTPGKYNVIIEGVTTDGEVFSVISVFEVKN
jgi:hypothetical protein